MDQHQNISAEALGLTQEQYLQIINCPDVYQQVINQFLQSKVAEENNYGEEEKIDARERERNEHVKRDGEHLYYPQVNDEIVHNNPQQNPVHLNLSQRNIQHGANPFYKAAQRRQEKERGLLEQRPNREHQRQDPTQSQVQEKRDRQRPGRNLKKPVLFHETIENEGESAQIEAEQVPGTVVPQEKPQNIRKIPEFTEFMTKKSGKNERTTKPPEHRFDISRPNKVNKVRRHHQSDDRSSQCNLF